MKRKFRRALVLVGLGLFLVACGQEEAPKEAPKEDQFLELEEKQEGEKELVRNKELEARFKKVLEELIEKKDNKQLKLVGQEVWVYKDREDKIYRAEIRMDLDMKDKEGAEKEFEALASAIDKAISSKFSYEKLSLIWTNQNYPEGDEKLYNFYG